VLDVLRDMVGMPDEIAGVSAGAAVAVIAAAGRSAETFVHFRDAVSRNEANFHPRRWLQGERAFPHEEMYRDALEHALANGGFERLQSSLVVRILQTSVQHGEPALRTVIRALRIYNKRKAAGKVHAPDGAPPGMSWRVFPARDATRPDELIDAVITSSATWPVTRIPTHNGRVWVDGGLVDNVPIRALSPKGRAGPVLVLLTRQYDSERLPQGNGRLYLAPVDPVPVQKWDYTRADLLTATFEMGRRDGRAARGAVESLLANEGLDTRQEG